MTYKEDNTPERRTKLDGGLNTHDSPFVVRPDQVVEVSNFRMDGGSLKLRDSALYLGIANSAVATARPTAPVLVDGGAGGSFAAGTYECKFFHTRWGSSSSNGDIGASSVSNALVLAGSRYLTIRIYPENLGVNAGLSAPVDDPFMGGASSSQVAVYLRKDAGNWEFQGLLAFTFTGGDRWQITRTSMITGLGQNPADKDSYWPVRRLMYYDPAKVIVAVYRNQSLLFNSWSDDTTSVPQVGGVGVMAYSVDKSGNSVMPFSCQPTDMDHAIVGRVLVATDGFRPKKHSWQPDGATTGQWMMLGANPPDAAPTMAIPGAAGAPNGVYSYRMTFIYRYQRPITRASSEYWYSESRPTTSASTVSPANQQVTVTFNALRGETGLYKIRLYRTVAGGSTYYRLADIDPSNTTYTDNIADSALSGRKTDPDDEGKVPCDTPPLNLTLVRRLGNRLIGMVGKLNFGAVSGQRAASIVGGNQLRLSKPQLATYADPNGSDVDDAEFSVDAWPNQADHTLSCGGDEDSNELLEYRGAYYLFKDTEIGVITGREPGELSYDTIYEEVGGTRNSAISAQGAMYFWSAARGAYRFDGRSFDWIGREILSTWTTDRDAGFTTTAAGYYCAGVVFDPDTSSIRWSFTNAAIFPSAAQLTSDQSNLSSVRGSYKEYVYNLESGGWTIESASSQTRDIRASCLASVNSHDTPKAGRDRVVFGTTIGTICADHNPTTANAYLDPEDSTPSTTITATATLKIHGLGEKWDYVKKFLYLFFSYTTGAVSSGSLLVECKANEATAWVTVGTVTATANGLKTEMMRIPNEIGSSMNRDRGLQIRFTSTFNAALSIHAVELRMVDDTPVVAQVRP